MAHFQEQGGRVSDDTFYVERNADRTLFERLGRHEMCVVLAPRQIGKSSLRNRTEQRLRESGVTAISVDLAPYTGPTVVEEWFYEGIIRDILRQLGWQNSRVLSDNADLPPHARWDEFVRQELPERTKDPTVIFLDEIENVRRLKVFEPDPFFTPIRLAINRPPITFCLLGTMTPWEFLRERGAPPFNVGVKIQLEDFTHEEAKAFLPGLRPLGNAERILDEVLQWTAGHPHLTQRVCAALVRSGSGDVNEIIERELLQLHGDALFVHAETHFDTYAKGPTGAEFVALYGKVLGNERVTSNANSREQTELRVTGMIAERDLGRTRILAMRNKIYEQHFDHAWLKPRRTHRFFTAAVTHWRESEHQRGLLAQSDLEDVVEWAASQESVSGEEMKFLFASKQAVVEEAEKAAERVRRRRDRLSLWTYGIGVAVLVGLAIVAVFYRQRVVKAEAYLSAERSRNAEIVSGLHNNLENLEAARRAELESVRTQLQRVQALAEDRAKAIASFEAKLKVLGDTLRDLEQAKAIDQARYRIVGRQLRDAEGAIETAQREYVTLQNRASEAQAEADVAKDRAAAAARQAQAATDEARRLERERASLEQQLRQMRDALALAERRATDSETARVGAEQALIATQNVLKQTQNDLNNMTSRKNDACSMLPQKPPPPSPPC